MLLISAMLTLNLETRIWSNVRSLKLLRSIKIPDFPAHKLPSQHYLWASLTHAYLFCKKFQWEKLLENKVALNKWYQEYVLVGRYGREVKSCHGCLVSVGSMIFVPQHVLVLWWSTLLTPVFKSWEQKQGLHKGAPCCPFPFRVWVSTGSWRYVPQGKHPQWSSTSGPETTRGPVPGSALFLG